jgi:hypothetical protein
MSKMKAMLLTVSMVPFVLAAQNLVKNGDAEANLEGWSGDEVQVVSENPHSGKNCFKTQMSAVSTGQAVLVAIITNSQILPVDPSKTYKISVWVKSADDKKTDVYLGVMPLDAEKVQINCKDINAVAETETELAEACNAGDTVIKVKEASKWNLAGNIDLIAFNVSEDCKDLPNRNISACAVTKAENKNNVWELTLNRPCGKAFPAGTKVRQHKYGPSHMLPTNIMQFNSPEWKELTAEIKGMSKYGSGGREFWAGTKYVQAVVFARNGGMIYFDDLKLEEQK